MSIINFDADERINGIINSNKLDELPLKYLPPVSDNPDHYYFVSYSHLDYKQVYRDIFALQAEGINIWYDRAMPAGESWRETAEKYIRPSKCAGVIFYISKNSLTSDAIHKEIEFAKKCGKSCLTINLPIDADHSVEDKSMRGAEVSAKMMMDVLIADGIDIAKDKYDFISKAFDNEVLFVPYSSGADFKADKILKLKKPPIFVFDKNFKGVELRAVNDIDILRVKASDFVFTDESGVNHKVTSIGACAFANCKNLESVELPTSINKLDKYAYFGCKNLTQINLENVKYIHEFAFAGCESLKCVTLKNHRIIELPNGVFKGCKELEHVELPAPSANKDFLNMGLCVIGKQAFCDCERLNGIDIPKSLFRIDEGAFENCIGLKEIEIPDSVTSIAKGAFYNCSGLEKLKLGAGITELNVTSFGKCDMLKSIRVSKNNPVFESRGNCVIAKESGELALGCKSSVIPDDGIIKSIGECAFKNCKGLMKINIPQSVKAIRDGAFAFCSSLKKIVLPDGVESIGEGAFGNCSNLTEIVIPDSVKSIGNMAFYACGSAILEADPNSRSADKRAIEDSVFTIRYNGTVKQWESFGELYLMRNAVVICTDGEL